MWQCVGERLNSIDSPTWASPTTTSPPASLRLQCFAAPYRQVAASATRLRTNGKYVPERQFLTRRLHLNKKDVGVLWKPPPQPNALQALAASQSDPSQMFGALKSQFAFLALNGGLGLIISFFFSGFLVAKAPFPLTYKFKSVLQRGVEVPGIDVTYVSSLSWYFFVLFGCSGIVAIFHNVVGREADSTDALATSAMAQINPAMASTEGGVGLPGGQGVDISKMYQKQREDLELATHEFALADVEARLLDSWKRAHP
eukprot:GHVU01129543.1.p2 GENE.GHVU01129543.1~~GHVU01129543.1.p2  ORF type:complete len:257 (+),score=43.13 GHVU01129543.1:622-1392(+)